MRLLHVTLCPQQFVFRMLRRCNWKNSLIRNVSQTPVEHIVLCLVALNPWSPWPFAHRSAGQSTREGTLFRASGHHIRICLRLSYHGGWTQCKPTLSRSMQSSLIHLHVHVHVGRVRLDHLQNQLYSLVVRSKFVSEGVVTILYQVWSENIHWWWCVQVFRGSVGEVVYCSMRRCLCYPLYRHWQLVQCVLQDTIQLFQLGILNSKSVYTSTVSTQSCNDC